MAQAGEGQGANGQTTDVDDDYLRWQEEIRIAEEEAEAMKAGKQHRYHKDFRKKEEKVDWAVPVVVAAAEVEDEERPASPPPAGEQEFTDDDGTVYKWDHALNAWVPQVCK